MTRIPACALAEKVRIPLEEHWGYIWGTSGQVWTQASQNAAARKSTRQHGQQWVGRRVTDCSGLLVWAFGQLGGTIYHGSDTIFREHCSQTFPLAGTVHIPPGAAVFQNVQGRRTHVGVYVGGGECIEARGTQSGVIVSPLSVWDEWGLLTDVDYADVPADTQAIALPQTTRMGDRGELVRFIQQALCEAGQTVSVDGVFGAKTDAAVRAVQTANGLAADGVVGPDTWAVLRAAAEPDEPAEAPAEPDWGGMSLEDKVDWLCRQHWNGQVKRDA
jgi:hypothetical protein